MSPEFQAFQQWKQYAFVQYMRDWAFDDSPFALALKGRQIAFTSASAGGAVKGALGENRPQLILSASQDLADEVLQKARGHCKLLAAMGHRWADKYTVDTKTEIAWGTTARIVALPANPRTARSFSGDVWLDEFAYHTDPEGIRDGAFAMASKGDYRIRVLSTPNGAQGLFYDWASDPPKGWKLHTVDIHKAKAHGFPVDLDKLWALAGGDERVFAQWYLCQFVDADQQYLSSDLLTRALNWSGTMPDFSSVSLYAGLDIGRHRDVTALTIIAVVQEVAWVVAVLTCSRSKFEEQEKMVMDAYAVLPWEGMVIDAQGIGSQMAERLADKLPSVEVEQLHITEKSKEDFCTGCFRWLASDKLRFPHTPQGEVLKKQGGSLRRMVTTSGNVTYQFPRTKDGHGDEFTSMMLALRAAGDAPTPPRLGTSKLFAVA